MKNIKKMLFSVLVIGLFLIGTNVEAKTVKWEDLVAKIKEGVYVENVNNAKNNGEDISLNIESDSTKFVATTVSEGITYTIQLDYNNGIVTFSDNNQISSSDIEALMMSNLDWKNDIIRAAGKLFNYDESEVVNFIKTLYGRDASDFSLEKDGIEFTYKAYDYEENGQPFVGEQLVSFKLNLVKGFAGLEECPEQNENVPEQPKPEVTPEPEKTPDPIVTPEEAPEEEPEDVENPATGDIQVYQVVGGIAVCMMLAIGAAIHLRKKEEII